MNLVDGQQFKEARPLDVHVWSDYPEVNGFVSEVFDDLVSLEGNEAIGKKNLKVILLDLYVAWCADPELKIMFSRDNNAYAAKSRYNELHISRKAIGIVDALEDAGYINQIYAAQIKDRTLAPKMVSSNLRTALGLVGFIKWA